VLGNRLMHVPGLGSLFFAWRPLSVSTIMGRQPANRIQANKNIIWFTKLSNQTFYYLTFRGPCIVIYSYNKDRRDALYLKFIFV